MRLKTSCFNPTLARNGLRRFWPLPLLLLLGLLLVLVLPFQQSLAASAAARASGDNEPLSNKAASILSSGYWLYCVLLAAAALVSALLLFSHLHGKKEIQFYLALPVKRGCMYTTSAVMGYLMVAVPGLLASLTVLGISLYYGAGAQPVLRFIAAMLLNYTLFYGMAVLSCVLAGQKFGALCLYLGLHFAALIIYMGGVSVLQCFVLGLSVRISDNTGALWIAPLARLLENGSYSMTYSLEQNTYLNENGGKLGLCLTVPGIYALAGLGILILAGILYQKRRAETAGEMLSFGPVRVLCKLFTALVTATGGIYLLADMLSLQAAGSFPKLLALVLLLTALGWLAAEMVIEKTLRVFHRRQLISCGAFLLAAAAILLGCRADMFGYVNHVPDAEEVESAKLGQYGANGTAISPESLIAFHKELLENREILTCDDSSLAVTLPIQLTYTLKNGDVLRRYYYVQVDAGQALLDDYNQLVDDPAFVYASRFHCWEDDLTEDTFYSGVIISETYYTGISGTPNSPFLSDQWGNGSANLTAREAVTLYTAICRDIEAGHVISSFHYSTGDERETVLAEISIDRYDVAYSTGMGTYENYQENATVLYSSISVNPTMEYTIAALEELGYTLK